MTKTLRRFMLSGSIALSGIALAACAATRVTTVKKEPSFDAKGMRRVLVVAVVRQPQTRNLLEDAFVRELKKRKCEGIPSYTLVRDDQKLDEAEWKKLVSANHFDAVIISRLTNYDVVETEVEPEIAGGPSGVAPVYGYGYGFYSSSQAAMYQPGFTIREEMATV